MSRRRRKNRRMRARRRAQRRASYEARFADQALVNALQAAIPKGWLAFLVPDPVWKGRVDVCLGVTRQDRDFQDQEYGLKDRWAREDFYRNLKGYRLRIMIHKLQKAIASYV